MVKYSVEKCLKNRYQSTLILFLVGILYAQLGNRFYLKVFRCNFQGDSGKNGQPGQDGLKGELVCACSVG